MIPHLRSLDTREPEADMAFTAGSDLDTILGVAGDTTITGEKKHGAIA